ncbi:hypothetical protein Dimus_006112, partial [Dionaea muscipula]
MGAGAHEAAVTRNGTRMEFQRRAQSDDEKHDGSGHSHAMAAGSSGECNCCRGARKGLRTAALSRRACDSSGDFGRCKQQRESAIAAQHSAHGCSHDIAMAAGSRRDGGRFACAVAEQWTARGCSSPQRRRSHRSPPSARTAFEGTRGITARRASARAQSQQRPGAISSHQWQQRVQVVSVDDAQQQRASKAHGHAPIARVVG